MKPALLRALGVVACLAFLAFLAYGQTPSKWLVIAATRADATAAIDSVKAIRARWPGAKVVASADCDGLRQGLLLVVVTDAADRPAADIALQRLRATVPDAYMRECRPRAVTTLAAGVPLIDPTIEQLPADAVNWEDADRLSAIVALPHGVLWLRRWYAADPNDPLEGRRESVLFFDENAARAKELLTQCLNTAAVQRDRWIALTCVGSAAADHLLHETTVVDSTTGAPLKSIPRCTRPSFVSDRSIRCDMESVDANGQLTLAAKTVPFR